MGTPWAADEHMHPGGHETVDSECVEVDVLFKMGHCAGFCTGGEAKRTCGPFTAAAAEDAIKRGLQHPYGKHCMLMCFIGKLVAEMGSGFLLDVLMEVPDDAELQMVVVGVSWSIPESWLLQASWKAVECLALLAGGDYTLLPGGSHVDMCCWRLCAREGGSSSLRLEA